MVDKTNKSDEDLSDLVFARYRSKVKSDFSRLCILMLGFMMSHCSLAAGRLARNESLQSHTSGHSSVFLWLGGVHYGRVGKVCGMEADLQESGVGLLVLLKSPMSG